jgi:hypothetical protein
MMLLVEHRDVNATRYCRECGIRGSMVTDA